METKKTFLYIACIVLFIKAAKTIWELINFSQIQELNNAVNSLTYKIGFLAGMLFEIVVFLGLIKIIYDYFLKSKSNKIKVSLDEAK